jgi:hypothetical protein
MPLAKRIQKIDPDLRTTVIGAKLQRHGAKTLCCGTDVAWYLAPVSLAPSLGASLINAMPWRHRSWHQDLTL